MEASIGIRGKDFVIIATDSSIKNSYLILKDKEDKFVNINNNTIYTYLGSQGDAFRTSLYIQERLKYEEIENNIVPTPRITANLIQNHIYKALRTNPLNNYFLIGGFNKEDTELYSVDMYGVLSQGDYMAVGISTYFCYGILDKEYREDISIQEGIEIIKKCVSVLRNKCSMDIRDVCLKIVSREGVVEETI